MMKLFIVEDSEDVHQRMESMLSEIPGIAFAGHATDELGAIERIDALSPHVVILDLCLRPGSGINVLEHVKRNHPKTKVFVLTNYADEFYEDKCRRAGADCFFDKTFQFSRLYSALWLLSNGPATADQGAV